jgi:alpha-glucosidase
MLTRNQTKSPSPSLSHSPPSTNSPWPAPTSAATQKTPPTSSAPAGPCSAHSLLSTATTNPTGTLDHEFYRFPVVAEAAKIAIKARYQLLDYLYTALYQQTLDGTPTLNPLFFIYPTDANTLAIQAQFFFGASILVSPVTGENATDVDIYLPDDQFYDFWTFEPVRGQGNWTTLTGVNYTQIPVHIRGGAIIPIRADGANTTTELRTLDFDLIVAPGLTGTATGSLYLDDGVSIEQAATSVISFDYTRTELSMTGTFAYHAGINIANVILLGEAGTSTVPVNKPLTGPFTLPLSSSHHS